MLDRSNYDVESYLVIGKYFFASWCIAVDIETGEHIVEFNGYDFLGTYRGGRYNMMLHNGQWYRVQIPAGDIDIDYDDYEPVSSEAGNGDIYQLDNTYYVIEDDYGMFLRTYEKGEAEEEAIYRTDE